MKTEAEALGTTHYCVFATAIGPCGIAWNARGLTRLQLPETDEAATAKRIAMRSGGRHSADPPVPIARIVEDVRRYALGANVDFSAAVLDLAEIDDACRSVYEAARALGWGETATYGEIARRVGMADPRDVGQALSRNPIPIIIPCHRVVASGGKLGGFSAYGGTLTKERLLALEGVGADAPRLPGL
ncbi:MAG: methylated-DNA--[protein]-cysteine S-methyltransferase [Xanthobacteraceae bacterium]